MEPALALGSWWSFAQAERGVVGLAVAAISVIAIAYLIRRILRARRGE
jgi:uncharacterized membrane protein (DUF2068 family)